MSANNKFSKSILKILLLWASVAGGLCNHCQLNEAQFSVSTKRNMSGHWTLNIFLAQENEGNPPRVHIHPTIQKCGTTLKTTLNITLEGTPTPPPPALGYVYIPQMGYYKVHLDPATWQEAKAVCEQEGTHLLILNSEAEATAIGNLLTEIPKAGEWFAIGANSLAQKGFYITIFGETLKTAGFERWDAGEPDSPEQRCMVLRRTKELHSSVCSDKLQFICEQEI